MKKIDLTGEKFGRLTVIGRGEKIKRSIKWLCRCECGNIKEIHGSSLKNGSTKSCGCLFKELLSEKSKQKVKDLAGKTFGRLTVVERDLDIQKKKKSKSAYWKCKCKCGKIKSIMGSALIRKDGTKSCGCLARELSVERGKIQNTKPKGEASKNAVYYYYRRGAKIRGHDFNLSKDEFFEILKKDCAYCGKSPSNVKKSRCNNGDFVYNGIDRIDNAKGYENGNCIPCCGVCNRMKGAMDYDDFISHIESICTHLYELD